jgi:hypothetical protein
MEVTMKHFVHMALGAAALLVCAGSIYADALPTCRVRVVRSAATEGVPNAIAAQVEHWADARDRGCGLVSSIDQTDVLLEFTQYKPTTMPDGTPAEEWWFIARRLSEPDRLRATYRFAYTTFLDRRTKAHVAKELPTVLSDVCFGYLPKLASTGQSRP